MPYPLPPVSVRLLVDLTSYCPQLTRGLEGVLTSFTGNAGDSFARIRFPGAGSWDILHRSYEVTDASWLDADRKAHEEAAAALQASVAKATKAIAYYSGADRFRGVSFEAGNVLTHSHGAEGEAILKQLQAAGIPITKEYPPGPLRTVETATSAVCHVGPGGGNYALEITAPDGKRVIRSSQSISIDLQRLQERGVAVKTKKYAKKLSKEEIKALGGSTTPSAAGLMKRRGFGT